MNQKRVIMKYENKLDTSVCRLRIRELMKARKMTCQELGDAIGASSGTVSSILSQSHNVSLVRLADIAKVLKVEMGELFDETGWNKKPVKSEDDEFNCDAMYNLGIGEESECSENEERNSKIGDIDFASYNLGRDFMLERKDWRRLMSALGVSYGDVTNILKGMKAVTPVQWSIMASTLSYKAFCVMENVVVKINDGMMFNYRKMQTEEKVRVYKSRRNDDE